MLDDLEVLYTDTGGIELAYAVVGEGPMTVVRVPPLSASLDLLGEVSGHLIERLARFARVVLMDRRGQGLSDRRGGLGTAEDRMDDVGAVMDAAGVDRAVVMSDHDGACLSLLFAATYPERVTGLVLSSVGAPRLRWAADYPIGTPDELIDAQLEVVAREWGTGRILAAFGDPALGTTDLHLFARIERSACTPRIAVEHFQRANDMDVRDALPLVRTPTLIIHGKRDLMPVAWAEFLAAHLADAVLVTPERYGLMEAADADLDPLIDLVEEFVTGQRPRPHIDVDRVLATVLFIDIVSSTEQLAAIGDRAWRVRLDEFRACWRDEIERYRGRPVNTRGDDVLATFDGTTRAVRCAQAITSRAASELGLSVRCGVHTGEVELQDDDVAGIAVHIGARVAALAGAGDVLVTSTVRDLTVGADLAFEHRAREELRGIPGTWDLYVLCP